MSDSTDFIPNEAKIEVTPVYFKDGVKNLADLSDNKDKREEIIEQVRGTVDDYQCRFVSQRNSWDRENDGIWNLQDAMWRSGLNDAAVQSEKSKGANEPDEWERAKTGSTLLYRQVRQKASNGYAVQTSKDLPFKYETLAESEFEAENYSDERAEKLNMLARWSMKQDRFNLKSLNFWTQLYKYGNVPVHVGWKQEIGKKKIKEAVFNEDGKVQKYKHVEIEYAKVNRPVFTILPVESLYADTAIGNIQDQECVIVSTVVSITEIAEGIRNGIYREDLLKDIGKAQQWDGFSGGHDNADNKKDNRGMGDEPTNLGTGQYLKREVFVNLPIDLEEEKWDEMKNIPVRYRITMFGNEPVNSAIACIERNQEPDDAIPIELIHANPDDDDILYHISDYEVIRSNIATETTIIRQLIDNNTLVNKPPLWEVDGAVRGNDRSFGPDARWKLDDPNAIGFFNVRPLAQENLPILQYVKEDSNTANSIDKNMLGESFGARTSASEATTISGNSRRPNLVNIEYVLEQFLGFYAQRLKVLWEAYGRHDQIVQITNENNERVFIKPDNLGGEYDIIIDIVDDIKEDEVYAQRLINGANVYAGNPQLSQTMNWADFSNVLSEKLFGTNRFIIGQNDGDAEENARQKLVLMLDQGVPLQGMTPQMNIKKHLEIYKEERKRWVGSEDQNPNIILLDNAIEQLEEFVASQASGGGQAQQQALPQAQAQMQQQLTSGAIGGIR